MRYQDFIEKMRKEGYHYDPEQRYWVNDNVADVSMFGKIGIKSTDYIGNIRLWRFDNEYNLDEYNIIKIYKHWCDPISDDDVAKVVLCHNGEYVKDLTI
jgi:hypothetical protein